MKKLAAALLAGVLAANLAATIPAQAVNIVTEIPDSSYLGDTTGTFTIQLTGGRDVAIQIIKDTLDGPITYYDTVLDADSTYQFTLDSCEYDIATEAYLSSYRVVLRDSIDRGCTYTEEGLLTPDPGFSLDVTQSAYTWHVTLVEGETRHASGNVTAGSNKNGVWTGSSRITMQYLNYVLGDVDGDGSISIQDSYYTLLYYANHAAGMTWSFADHFSGQSEDAAFAAADIDANGEISIDDAYRILTYYAQQSAGLSPSWD